MPSGPGTTYSTVEEARVLFQLSPGHIDRLLRIVLKFDPRKPKKEFSCREFFVCGIADWLTAVTPIVEMQQCILFEHMDENFERHIRDLDQRLKVAGEVIVPNFVLVFSKYQYVIWPGRQKHLDLQKDADVPKLPRPAIFSVLLNTNELFFFNLARLEQLRDDQRKCRDALASRISES